MFQNIINEMYTGNFSFLILDDIIKKEGNKFAFFLILWYNINIRKKRRVS
jgi:hypothetical protein